MADLTKEYKVTFHGNKSLIIGKLGDNGVVTDAVWGTGLVSMDAMENQAESTPQYADDEVWTVSAGAPLLQGSLTFMQLNSDLRVDFFGQTEVKGMVGNVAVTGYGDSGVYPQRIVEYLIEGTATSKKDGSVVAAALLTVYPNCQVRSAPTKTSETDTDSINVVNWSANIQATTTEKFKVNGKKLPAIEVQVVGDANVAELKEALASGKFFEIGTGKPVVTG